MAFPAATLDSMPGKPSWHHLWELGSGRRVSSKTVPNSRVHPYFHSLFFLLPSKHFSGKWNKLIQEFHFLPTLLWHNRMTQTTQFSYTLPCVTNTCRFILPHECSQGQRENSSLPASSTPVMLKWLYVDMDHGGQCLFLHDWLWWAGSLVPVTPTNHNGCGNKVVCSQRVWAGTLKGVLYRRSKVYLP